MKLFRHTNGFLYSIEQIGRGKNITPPKDWKCFEAVPYKTNKEAPTIKLDEKPDLTNFILVSEV